MFKEAKEDQRGRSVVSMEEQGVAEALGMLGQGCTPCLDWILRTRELLKGFKGMWKGAGGKHDITSTPLHHLCSLMEGRSTVGRSTVKETFQER